MKKEEKIHYFDNIEPGRNPLYTYIYIYQENLKTILIKENNLLIQKDQIPLNSHF